MLLPDSRQEAPPSMPSPPTALHPAPWPVHAIFHAAGHDPGMAARVQGSRENRHGRWRRERGMEPTEDLGEYTTLIVRVRQDDAGRLSGVVERVRTGEKVRFHGLETLSRAVTSLLSTTAEGS